MTHIIYKLYGGGGSLCTEPEGAEEEALLWSWEEEEGITGFINAPLNVFMIAVCSS